MAGALVAVNCSFKPNPRSPLFQAEPLLHFHQPLTYELGVGLTTVLEMPMKTIATLLLLIISPTSWAGEFGPWTFGMSQEQVLAETAEGPYRAFSNGNLETYSGEFFGSKRNFQFYFEHGSLRRIAIRTYEGPNLDQATTAWQQTYEALQARFGEMEAPYIEGTSSEELAAHARSRAELGESAQMAPMAQPNDAVVFGSLTSVVHEGVRYYAMTVNLDQPQL